MPLAKTWRAEPTSSMAAHAGRPETVRAARDANDEYDLGEPNAGSATAPIDPIRNPYAPGAGTRPPAVAARDAEIESFRVFGGGLRAGTPSIR
jgi:hypothetical protein